LLVKIRFANLLDCLPESVVTHEDGELFNVSHRLSASVCILKLASDVGEAIAVEQFRARCVLAEHLDVNFGERFHGLTVVNLELTILNVGLDLELRGVECLELLDVIRVNFNHNILSLQLCRQRNTSDFASNSVYLQLVEWLDVAELLSLVFDERRSGEENLSVNQVVLHCDFLDVVRVDFHFTSEGLHLNIVDNRSLLLGDVLSLSLLLLVCFLVIICVNWLVSLALLNTVLVSFVNFSKLFFDLLEENLEMFDRIIIVLFDDSSCVRETFLLTFFNKEVKIGLHVVVGHLAGIVVALLLQVSKFDGVEYLDCLIDSVLELKEVCKLETMLRDESKPGVGHVLVHNKVQERSISVLELHVQNFFVATGIFFHFLLFTDGKDTLIHNWEIFKMFVLDIEETEGGEGDQLTANWLVNIVYKLAVMVKGLHEEALNQANDLLSMLLVFSLLKELSTIVISNQV